MELQLHLMLCDHAAAIGPRLYINGGGWDVRSPMPQPWALALEVKVPWHDNNRSFPYVLELLDADGQPVEVDTPKGKQPIKTDGNITLTARPGLKPGSQIVGVAAALLLPIPLPPDAQYEWKLTLDGHTRDEWRVAFSTSAMPAGFAAAAAG